MAIDSWSLVRVFGTWVNHGGTKLAGKYKVTIPARLTNSADDLIIPAGIFAQGDLVVAEGVPSLSLMVPATDDPDIQQDGWLVIVEVSFSGAQAAERYIIEVPIADRPSPDGGTGAGVNLRTIMLTAQQPPQIAMYGVGRRLGLALLSEDGLAVLDADGNPITGGGGGGSSAWGEITDKPAVIAAGASQAEARTEIDAAPSSHSHEAVQVSDSTSVGRQVLTAASAAEARTAIGAGTSSLEIGTTGSTAAAGNDSRLSDARTPLAHNHTAAQVTDFTAAALTAAPAETATTIGTLVNAAAAKATPVDADMLLVADSAASNVGKKLTWAGLKATLKTYLDTLYATVTHSHAAADITSGTIAAARIPAATESAVGGLEIATTGEATTGSLDTVIITPAKLKAVTDAAGLTAGTLALARMPVSVVHRVFQASDGTWPGKPAVPAGASVEGVGYPGRTDAPGWLDVRDSYVMVPA